MRKTALTAAVLIATLSVGVGNRAQAEWPHDANWQPPKTLMLRATVYSIALEQDYAAGSDAAFKKLDGTVLYKASRAFVAAASIQGSARLKDGRMLMFGGRDNGEVRWKFSPHGYAVGSLGCRLTPFRSAAVDKRVIPLGSKLIIPETRGMMLPDGTRHDGVWYAVDTGRLIKDSRIDLFVGAGKAPLATVKRHGIGHLEPLRVHLSGAAQGCPSV